MKTSNERIENNWHKHQMNAELLQIQQEIYKYIEQQLIENKSMFNTHSFDSPEHIIDAGSLS
jgi:hypothetical protein